MDRQVLKVSAFRAPAGTLISRPHALDYIEIYKRLASDSDDTAGDKVSVFRRTA
jgi:hypothetical protein